MANYCHSTFTWLLDH